MALRKLFAPRSAGGMSRKMLFRHPASAGLLILMLLGTAATAQLPAPLSTPPGNGSRAQSAPVSGRVFCDQKIAAQPADPDSLPENYRQFAGIFSDASWNPQLCAALIVEKIAAVPNDMPN